MDTIYFIRYTKTKCKSKVDQNRSKPISVEIKRLLTNTTVTTV